MSEFYLVLVFNVLSFIFSVMVFVFIKNHDKIIKKYLGDSEIAEYVDDIVDNVLENPKYSQEINEYANKYAEMLVPPHEYVQKLINPEDDDGVEVITNAQEKEAEQRRNR